MVEPSIGVESLLIRAKEQERKYDWLGAVEIYENAIQSVAERRPSSIGGILDRKAYASYKAAFQAKTTEEFLDGIRSALESCQKARSLHEEIDSPESKARLSRCDAMISLIGYWQKDRAGEKKELIHTAWQHALESLEWFKSSGSGLEYAKTFNRFLFCVDMMFNYASDLEGRKKPVMEALGHGEQAVKFLEGLGEPEELTRALLNMSILERAIAGWFFEPDKAVSHFRRSYDLWCKAKDVCADVAFAELGLCDLLTGITADLSTETAPELPVYREALEYSRRTKDRLIIGGALEMLAYVTGWPVGVMEDPEQRESTSNEALRLTLEAKDEFAVISFRSPNWAAYWADFPEKGHLFCLAIAEIDVEKKRELFEKLLDGESEYLRLSRAGGYPPVEQSTLFALGVSLKELAKMEQRPEVKRKLLEKALDYGKRQLAIEEKYDLYHFMNLSSSHYALGETLYETSKIVDSEIERIGLIKEAIVHDKKSIAISTKGMSLLASTDLGVISSVSNFYLDYGRRLRHLGQLTNDPNSLREAAEAFERSVELALKMESLALAAEENWEAAKTYDLLQDHAKAADRFESASDSYRKATEKIPSLKAFYKDFVLYMSAWAEIERAKYSHLRLDFESAMKHYQKAASLHSSTEKWSYLSSNYAAWAEIENGEGLSRNEHPVEAVKVFEDAVRLFDEATKSLEVERSRIGDTDEKEMVNRLIRAAEHRKRYCKARVALESAKILGRTGDGQASSDKYGQAAEMFQKIHDELDSEQDKRELQLIIRLSKAWQAMARAEADGSAEAYAEASLLFDHAKDLSPGEKARSLALGHSKFAKAMEIGTKFAETMDVGLHASAAQQLESASVCYLKADLGSASEYAKACKHLFDGYVHMNKANGEDDQEKKVKLYAMTEKVLQASAASFDKAEQPKKKEQVLRLLEKVKEERELAMSLTEVMKAPEIVSTTKAFSALSPRHETPVGLEGFQFANVQFALIAKPRELTVGDGLNVEIELVNAGKGPAQLVKVEKIIPEGFDVLERPENYKIEDHYLNLKGRRLDPLRTEEARLVLKPTIQGRFSLKPRVLYLDESGTYKSYEAEGIEITVRELGISGWLRGPEKKK